MNNKNSISEVIKRARQAHAILETYEQGQLDDIIKVIAWEVIKPENNQRLSQLAVETTGLGHVESKKKKNYRKTMGLLRDLEGVKTVGVIRELPEKGLVEIARSVGVVCAIVPSTNPVATPLNKAINSVKCGNAVVLAPSPKGDQACTEMVELIQNALKRMGVSPDIVQRIPSPVTKEATEELTKQADLVVATGSQNNIARALQSGTPTLGVGVGNVPSIIDTSADIEKTVALIHASKTFDYATSCSSENSIIVLDSIYADVLEAFRLKGGILLNASEKNILQQQMWDANGVINRNIVAQSASDIARLVGFNTDTFKEADILLVEETHVGKEHPFSREKLSPVLAVYKASDFNDALGIANKILQNQGNGHSVGIHTKDDDHILALGLHLQVCRVVVNQAHCFAVGGNFDNGMPFSLSMGCGSWGNNVMDENMHYKHFMNITKIIRTISPVEPTETDIFRHVWRKYECK